MDGDLSVQWGLPIAHVVKNRGALSHYAKGEDRACRVTFTVKYVAQTGRTATGAPASILDALTGVGNASSWVSTELCGGLFTTLLRWTNTSPADASLSDEDEDVDIDDFYCEDVETSEGEEFHTIRISGPALVTKPTSTRS